MKLNCMVEMSPEELKRFIISHELCPAGTPYQLAEWKGTVRDYIASLKELGFGDWVYMKFAGSFWTLPSQYATDVFLKGGEFINA